VKTENADVLVLAGDICVATQLQAHDDPWPTDRSMNVHQFFQDACRQFPVVIYIAGNHEHYHGDFRYTLQLLRGHLGYLDNLHILDKECFEYDGVTFIGGTLWTDMNKEDPLTLQCVGQMMNDFRIIKNSNNKVQYKEPVYGRKADGQTDWNNITGHEFRTRDAMFTTQDCVEDHKKMLGYIKSVVEGKYDQKFVVVGHHTPSKMSIHPRFKDESLMNGGYSSELSEYILDHPQIKVWVHGHTHDRFDYMIGDTRVVCNPRGYIGYEATADNFQLQYIEV
jgi:predicted phosphodiesterase